MTQQTISSEILTTIVRALANGMSLQQVTEDSKLPYTEVTRIAKANGYPNRVMLAQSADRLEHQKPFVGERPPSERIPPASLGGLLKRAHELGLGKKADRIRDLVHQLEDEVERKEPLAAALAELARARAKVDQLRGRAPEKPAVRGGAMDGLNREERKAVKAWAAEHGRPVTSPTVPKDVVEAYRAAKS